jgi:hypothetical protein
MSIVWVCNCGLRFQDPKEAFLHRGQDQHQVTPYAAAISCGIDRYAQETALEEKDR